MRCRLVQVNYIPNKITASTQKTKIKTEFAKHKNIYVFKYHVVTSIAHLVSFLPVKTLFFKTSAVSFNFSLPEGRRWNSALRFFKKYSGIFWHNRNSSVDGRGQPISFSADLISLWRVFLCEAEQPLNYVHITLGQYALNGAAVESWEQL